MSIIIKTPDEIEKLREGGKILAQILQKLSQEVVVGMTTKEIDVRADELVRASGGTAAFLGYTPHGVKTAYPASICVSINDEVVHGIPSEDVIIQTGDIVSLDLGLKYKNMFTDHAVTIAVGPVSKKQRELIDTCRESLLLGIDAIKPGARVGDIGNAVQTFVEKRKFGIVRGLAGHGVGRAIHEDPYVPNYGRKGTGEPLRPGMVIAVEPMITIGNPDVVFLDDEYTVVTTDGSKSAHFEHTVLITETGYEILTLP